MRIGIDMDGCLANYNNGFKAICLEVTKKDLFPSDWDDMTKHPHTWHYPLAYGYTKEELEAVIAAIHADRGFWYRLKPYKDEVATIIRWADGSMGAHDVYFITNRNGHMAKYQSEMWLRDRCNVKMPTVIVTADKGNIAKGLRLDFFVDDFPTNIIEVGAHGVKCALFRRPWNADMPGVRSVRSMQEFLEGEGLL